MKILECVAHFCQNRVIVVTEKCNNVVIDVYLIQSGKNTNIPLPDNALSLWPCKGGAK